MAKYCLVQAEGPARYVTTRDRPVGSAGRPTPNEPGFVATKKDVDVFFSLRHLLGVRRFRHILFVVAAMLWLPASAHCQLETIGGLELLRCASSNPSGPSQGHCENGCCAAEHSQYNGDHGRLSVSIPVFLQTSTAFSIDAPRALPDEVSLGVLTAAPPELPKAWQFSFRTALPVRAPSLLS